MSRETAPPFNRVTFLYGLCDPFLPTDFDLSPYDRQATEQADRLRSSPSSDARAGAAEALGFLRAYSAEGDLVAALRDKSALVVRYQTFKPSDGNALTQHGKDIMKTNRREFINAAVAGGLAATVPLSSGSKTQGAVARAQKAEYSRLDEILKQPVLKKELFATPVIIDTLELLRFKNSFLCRVRSTNDNLANKFSTSVLYQGKLYGVHGNTIKRKGNQWDRGRDRVY